jgi:hypothetical protein
MHPSASRRRVRDTERLAFGSVHPLPPSLPNPPDAGVSWPHPVFRGNRKQDLSSGRNRCQDLMCTMYSAVMSIVVSCLYP